MKNFFLTIAVFAFTFFSSISFAGSLGHTKNLHNYLKFENLAPASDINVYMHSRSRIDSDNLRRAIKDIKENIGYPDISGQCAKKMSLSVYIIPYEILNNRDAMSAMINWPTVGEGNIVGIFDNRHKYEHGFIYVSDSYGEREAISTIAHEMYHAKQRANCRSGPEEAALDFEKRFCSNTSYC